METSVVDHDGRMVGFPVSSKLLQLVSYSTLIALELSSTKLPGGEMGTNGAHILRTHCIRPTYDKTRPNGPPRELFFVVSSSN